MKKKLEDFSTDELTKAFGDLDDESIGELLAKEGKTEWDPELEIGISETLGEIAKDVSSAESEEISEVPQSIQASIDQAKSSAMEKLAAEEAALEEVNSERRSISHADSPSAGWLARIFSSIPNSQLVAAAAVVALMVGAVFLARQSGESSLPSGSVAILTPGPKTGFADPTFVWETEDERQLVSLEVVDASSGKTVARVTSVESPIQFSAMGGDSLLEQGTSYQVRLLEGDSILGERNFATMPRAVLRGPRREPTLEGVIQQCEGFIASGRPADAWMLWTQLTEAEKQDPRMQDLKKIILEKIG